MGVGRQYRIAAALRVDCLVREEGDSLRSASVLEQAVVEVARQSSFSSPEVVPGRRLHVFVFFLLFEPAGKDDLVVVVLRLASLSATRRPPSLSWRRASGRCIDCISS